MIVDERKRRVDDPLVRAFGRLPSTGRPPIRAAFPF